MQVDSLAEEVRADIEADSFWCMTRVLDGIQDNYTFAQPGIQVTEYIVFLHFGTVSWGKGGRGLEPI
jgi:hypothetical protein